MAAGVTIEDPATAYIDRDVTIGADTIMHPACRSKGSTTIGAAARSTAARASSNSQIGDA
jgi:bifunctional UDP-N-acetylglucosamine pyrophosphorylase/glucosamine-1-phosphate N-acetyltransferase